MALIVTTIPTDIAVDLGRDPATLSTLDIAQFQRWINDAELLISQRIGALVPDPNVVDYVVRQAVVATAQAPAAGITSESVQIDDGQYTTRFDRAPRRVTILPEWWAMLGVTNGRGSAFSIDMTAADLASHAAWCDLCLGGVTCSCGASIAGYPIFEV